MVADETPAIRTLASGPGEHRWEMVLRGPHPMLADYVLEYGGYTETSSARARQVQVPHEGVVLLFDFGPEVRVSRPGRPRESTGYRHFVAGLHRREVVTEWRGPLDCLQVNLTPFGALVLLGQPMHSLVDRTVELGDLVGAEADRLATRLYEAPGWAARFAILDDLLRRRIAGARPPAPGVLWAWREICRLDGSIDVASLRGELGWSRKHFATQFREQVGLPPKRVAAIVRFQKAVRLLKSGQLPRLADVAHESGYYDQAHFNRDFRRFAGSTPGDYHPDVVVGT